EARAQLGVPGENGGLVEKGRGVLGTEQHAGRVVVDQLGEAAHVAGQDGAAHGHGLERLEGSDKLGEPHPQAWADEDIDERVVVRHAVIGNLARKDDAGRRRGSKSRLLLSASNEEEPGARQALAELRERLDYHSESFVVVEGADEAEDGAIAQA